LAGARSSTTLTTTPGEAVTDELVHYDLADGVATITLDSPHNRNALSRQLVTELFDALDRAEEEPEAKVVVIRSADRVFCSGADLSEAASGGMEEGTRALVALQRRIVTHTRPVVTRLAGPVRAGGLGIVAASDVVLCSEEVTFAFTESRLALAPAVISLTVLPRLTSRAAAETFLTGRTFDASEAASMGLVTRAVPADGLDAAVAEVCSELAQAHRQGLRETKALLARDLVQRIDAQAEEMAALSARLFGSDEAREAMTAFLGRTK
jgi:enoyl-CoA hydratase/carnithine racemase